MGAATSSNHRVTMVTGADTRHFANSKVLLGSWRSHMPGTPLLYCDFGLTAEQRAELKRIDGVQVLPAPRAFPAGGWEAKAQLGSYLAAAPAAVELLIWIDADAVLLKPLPDMVELMEGYDLAIDAHVQSVGEIVHDCNLGPLGLRRDDAYFSSGFWTLRRGRLLTTWAQLADRVKGQGNLWENDAFVAAIYAERLKVRTLAGGVWHARIASTLFTCEVRGLDAWHEGQTIYVVHANGGYHLRADGRRVFQRPELAAIQDHYEQVYSRLVATGL